MFESASGLIQTMLAPGIMISACGLLLLGMNNKYSLVVNRIRLLNEERRKLRYEELEKTDRKKRHRSIDTQIEKLSYRVVMVRNAVFAYSLAVAFFIIASVLIGINQLSGDSNLGWTVIIIFLVGMLFVFAGVVFAAIETWKGYKIVEIEIKDVS
jgi:sterol desaturase/sphingolipid hydroxylase (fatty acid hydroxylase superfamily)